MKKITLLLCVLPLITMAQTFDFTGADGGWTGVQATLTQNPTSVTISFDADTDPKLRHTAANIADPVTNGIIGITLKNNSTATEFRFVFENLQSGGTAGTVVSISPNDTAFQTYYIDLSDDDRWDNAGSGGTQNSLDFAFREPGGSSADNSVNNAGAIEIDKIIFVDVQPRPEKTNYAFDTAGDDEGWSSLVDATAIVAGGVMTITPSDPGNAIAKVTNGVNSVDADANSYMHIVYRNVSADNNQLRFQFRSAVDNYTAYIGTNVAISQSMSNFETLSIDLEAAKPAEWSMMAQDFQLAIRNTNNAGNASSAGDLIIDQIVFNNDAVLNIDSQETFKVSIYPNPASNILNIEGFKNLSKVELFDVLGKKVLQSDRLINNQLNVETLNSGIYLLRLMANDNSMMVKKIIIK